MCVCVYVHRRICVRVVTRGVIVAGLRVLFQLIRVFLHTHRSVDHHLRALTTVFSSNTLAHFPKTIQREFITLKGDGTGAQDQGRSFNTLLFLSCPRCCSPQFRACNLRPHLPPTSGGSSTQYFPVSNFVTF